MGSKFKTAVFFCISALFSFSSCNNYADDTVYDDELIFTNSLELEVDAYQYKDSTDGLNYQVSGDTTLDTLGKLPEFRWEEIKYLLVSVAIFNKPISISDGNIQNTENIIWQWHSGMDSVVLIIEDVEHVQVHYNWGKPVIEKNIQYETQPLALESGLYYWAVWSWDGNGKEIMYSSKPMKFEIE